MLSFISEICEDVMEQGMPMSYESSETSDDLIVVNSAISSQLPEIQDSIYLEICL